MQEAVLTVHCTKCGTENAEGAQYCTECGAPLYPPRARHEKYEKQEKAEREMCFGAALPTRYFWLIIGLLIVLWGVVQLIEIFFQISLNLWPLIVIAIGLYIIYRVLSRSQRK